VKPGNVAGRPPSTVLVVEDEPQMRFLLSENLQAEGYCVMSAESGEAALAELGVLVPSLMIVDVMLPRMSGFELCRLVRARRLRLPIIVLTARSEESDRVIGLDLGADDYVTKPFSVRELLARVRVQLRHVEDGTNEADHIMIGRVRVDIRRKRVTRQGQRLDLSTREFELLRYLLAHRGELVTREQLLRDVWGYSQVMVTRTVDNFVAKLRCHIEPTPAEPEYLITVHGKGYQFVL
jgi:DNA-binding response OmpR family regulator